MKAFFQLTRTPRVRVSVEGYDTSLPEDDIKKALTDHFSSCSEFFSVKTRREPESGLVHRRAFISLRGDGAQEKALELNGSHVGGGTLLVKVAPENDEETDRYRASLIKEVYYDKNRMFGISVTGHDTSLPADDLKSALGKHFASCGEITHIYINTVDSQANIYFSGQDAEEWALKLDGTKVGGLKVNVRPVATVRSNCGGPGIGYCVPAHCLEMAGEIGEKIMAFKRMKGML